MLDEVGLRKPGARLDVPVTLGGQSWHLPKPRVRLGVRRGPDGARVIDPRSDLGIEFDALLQAYEGSLDRPGGETILRMFDLASAMIEANYAIPPGDLDSLLVFDLDDPENVATWQTIIATARGQGPKPNGSGDELDS